LLLATGELCRKRSSGPFVTVDDCREATPCATPDQQKNHLALLALLALLAPFEKMHRVDLRSLVLA
jgi:hypothetical protein